MITRKQLRLWGACYDDKRIASIVPEEGLMPLEIAALENVPTEDRLWVLLREEVIPSRALRLSACDWAEAACRKSGWADERSLAAIAVARRFAVGDATEAELAAAHPAAVKAREAARAASRAATWAAWSAAWLVAEAWPTWAASAAAEARSAEAEAAAVEARAAARSASEAARSASEAAAQKQLADVVKVLRG